MTRKRSNNLMKMRDLMVSIILMHDKTQKPDDQPSLILEIRQQTESQSQKPGIKLPMCISSNDDWELKYERILFLQIITWLHKIYIKKTCTKLETY